MRMVFIATSLAHSEQYVCRLAQSLWIMPPCVIGTFSPHVLPDPLRSGEGLQTPLPLALNELQAVNPLFLTITLMVLCFQLSWIFITVHLIKFKQSLNLIFCAQPFQEMRILKSYVLTFYHQQQELVKQGEARLLTYGKKINWRIEQVDSNLPHMDSIEEHFPSRHTAFFQYFKLSPGLQTTPINIGS